MRPPLPDFTLPVLVLTIGVWIAGSGITGITRDISAALPVQRPSPGRVHPPDMAWWLRRCLAVSQCRGPVAGLLGSSIAVHGRVLWCGLLGITAAAAWLGALHIRLLRPPRSIGSARFASRTELHNLTHRSPGAWFPLGYAWRRPLPGCLRHAAAFFSPVMAWAHPVRLPEEDLGRHVLVLGLTGAHKTTSVTFPVLLEAAHAGVSVVALDLKYGEEDSLARVAPEWMRCGRAVLVFAPVDPLSLRWNPLASCRSLGEAHRLASLLFDEGDTADTDPLYWMGAERHVCAALIFAIATDGNLPTLERLRALCAAGPGAVHSYVQTHPVAQFLTVHLGAYLAMLPKDEAGILQGIASRLDAWSDEVVCRATGGGDDWEQIDFGRLRREPLLLIVGVPQTARSRLRWLCRLFLRDLASCLLRPRGPHEEVRVLQVLEELPAWGPLPGLADHLATFRSRHVSVLATIQSEAQGASVYGSDGWAAIAANLVTKIYFASLADFDAERLSRFLGTALAEDVARSRGWGSGGSRGQEHRRQIPLPLRRPEELQGIGTDEEEILVRCPRLPPARLWCPPFFTRPEYRRRVPDFPPSTADLVVYHHLRHLSTQDDPARARGRAVNDCGPPAPLPLPPHTQTAGANDLRVAGAHDEVAHHPCPNMVAAVDVPDASLAPASGLRPPDAATVASSATAQDVGLLTRFVERLVNHLTGPRLQDRPRLFVRGVHRIGRLVEVRVDPEVALRLCGDPAATPAIIRRWAALHWVRRVRPVFVLERRAIEALDASLRRRLSDACSPEPG